MCVVALGQGSSSTHIILTDRSAPPTLVTGRSVYALRKAAIRLLIGLGDFQMRLPWVQSQGIRGQIGFWLTSVRSMWEKIACEAGAKIACEAGAICL